jgi:NAD(P)-dependent dehydrogenase (short-subunit alcohol dehydrogenase family)
VEANSRLHTAYWTRSSMNSKVILISGANSNIGSKLAENYLDDGFSVLLLVHKNQERIEHLKSLSKRVYVASCDLSDWKSTTTSVQQIIAEATLLPYALIHTATIRSNDSLSLVESDPVKWADIIQTNILVAYHIVKAVLPYMLEQHEGRIVLFGSEVSRSGLAFGTAYAASKSAISNMTKSLALELADSGILVNTLSPGPVQTDDQQFEPKYREFRKEYFTKQLSKIALNRFVTISDIYPLCKFLSSEQNSYLTGEEIFLAGGKL